MNPSAIQELVDLIMLEDFVQRRQALDVWSRRWVATLMLEHPVPLHQVRTLEKFHGADGVSQMAKAALLERMLTGILLEPNVKATRLEVEEASGVRTTRMEMYVILQEPRGINEGQDAAKAMMAMAKGEKL